MAHGVVQLGAVMRPMRSDVLSGEGDGGRLAGRMSGVHGVVGTVVSRRPQRALVRSGPGLVELRFTQKTEYDDVIRHSSALESNRHEPNKRPITEFSQQSRRNLQKACLAFPWHELGRLVTVTLTYPDVFPEDGKIVKSHAQRLWQAWDYTYGGRPRGIWGLEFQPDRGAPHFHAFLGMPRYLEYDQLREWGFETWSRIVGFDEQYGPIDTEQHWRMGLRFRVTHPWFAAGRSGVVIGEYLWRHSGKWTQKVVPAEFKNVGRFWGVLGGAKREPWLELCCASAGYQYRRVLNQLKSRQTRAGARYPAVRGGGWSQSVNGTEFQERVMWWAIAQCGCRWSQSMLVQRATASII